MVRGYQSQVKWAGRVPYHAYAWPRALHSRFTDAQALRAGELSRGVGLRGFESHSPHQPLTLFRAEFRQILLNGGEF